ncbi:MAG TPA: tripartite tricarboxylate transporter substrate binding protein [Burkholderiales bacterium]|nr:tripartite tricarboxylate transporter substrate binding protein [Burkholderiales bacterium]
MQTLCATVRWLLAASAVALPLQATQAASAQTTARYPGKPVHLLMPFPAGGTPDALGRTVASQVEGQLGQNFVVDNRTGANGIIAYQLTANAAPDGYTLVHATPSFALNTIVFRKLPYSFKDFAPVSNIAQGYGYVMVVHPSVAANSVKELIALAKTTQLTYGSPGVGNTLHLATELFAARAGIKMLHVPYKGVAPALAALLGGEIQMMIVQPPAGVPQAKAGKLRAIAFTGAKRWAQMPDLPTVSESGVPGFVAHFTWNAWFAPAGTPRAIVMRLQSEVHKAVQVPKVHDFLVQGGWEPLGSTPEELDAYVKAEVKRYAEAARVANVHPE